MSVESISVGWDDFTVDIGALTADQGRHRGWIYVLCESSGQPLYVGQTSRRLRQRISEHRKGESPVLRKCKMIGRYVDRIDAFQIPLDSLNAVESELIDRLRPPVNVRR